MIALRPASERGHADHGWLEARHSFSFADYQDSEQMGWGVLRVINEDRIQPGTGFGMHGHRDMEIITWVLAGALEHKDSLGNGAVIRPGEIQYMSAGKGILHSEFNPSGAEITHLLQIWIEPAERGGRPGYGQQAVSLSPGELVPVASPDGRGGSLVIRQDAVLSVARLEAGDRLALELAPGRLGYLHLAHGAVHLNGLALASGDGARIAAEGRLAIEAGAASELLFFDLPPRD